MSSPESGRRCLGRYEISAELGRGGMAVVYRVLDPVTGEFLACKQLMAAADARVFEESCARFEREFHTLSELSHPRIIEVYDYALDAAGPFYTMELLDGGDLVARSPLAWQEACGLFHDVCSSLALLHSRRLVHCDITPRNIRCTKDGRAK
jgi:serine/threonine-protein kinase